MSGVVHATRVCALRIIADRAINVMNDNGFVRKKTHDRGGGSMKQAGQIDSGEFIVAGAAVRDRWHRPGGGSGNRPL